MKIDFPSFIKKFDTLVARGFSSGLGDRDGQMCVEAAICYALDLPHGDDPECVGHSVRSYKIRLNDAEWSSPQARAAGLRDLGIAQIGSRGIVDDTEFSTRLCEKTIRVLIPALFREIFSDGDCLAAADRCEKEGSADSAARAASAAWADSADRAASAAWAAARADSAAWAAARADSAAWADKYLLLSASLALETLRELKSPGCAFIGGKP